MAAIYKGGKQEVQFGGFDSPDAALEQAKYDLEVCGCTSLNQWKRLESGDQLPLDKP